MKLKQKPPTKMYPKKEKINVPKINSPTEKKKKKKKKKRKKDILLIFLDQKLFFHKDQIQGRKNL